MALARTTFLEAVNRVLQMLGEAPVNGLDGQFGLAQQAQDMLNDTSRKVQSEGWSFNTDYERLLMRDAVTSEISVGANVSRVKVDPYSYPDVDVIQRGARLYDRRAGSYEFDEDLRADVTYILEWDEVPEYAHQYFTIKARYELALAHARLSLAGSKDIKLTVGERADMALVSTEDLHMKMATAEALVRASRANASRIRVQVDIARSIGTSVRTSMDLA